MPAIRFLGFPTGASVSLGATQGAASDSISLAQWNVAPSAASLSIETVMQDQAIAIAPIGIRFEATQLSGFTLSTPPAGSTSYDPQFHEIFYEWDFGDPGDTYEVATNQLPTWRDANKAYGKLVTHVYPRPGIYTVRCTARQIVDLDPLTLIEASNTTTVVVADRSTVFGPHNTMVVALDGDFTGAPPVSEPNRQYATTLDGPYFGGADGEYRRGLRRLSREIEEPSILVLVKRGENYDRNLVERDMFTLGECNHLHIATWGDPEAPRPTFSVPQGWLGADIGAPTITWQDIEVFGQYDQATQTGEARTLLVSMMGGFNTYYNVAAWNGDIGLYIKSFSDFDSHTFTRECAFGGMRAYGIFGDIPPGGTFGMTGCMELDAGDAPHGGAGTSSIGNAQGPVRITVNGNAHFDANEFFCRIGWSAGPPWPVEGVGSAAEQPIFRLSGTGGTANITRCVGEGGPFLSVASNNASPPPTLNTTVDMVVHTSSALTARFVGTEIGAITLRNTLYIKPEVANAGALSRARSYKPIAKSGVPLGVVAAEPIADYNNTTVVLGDRPVFDDLDFGEDWARFDAHNNLVYAPEIAGQNDHVDLAPFDATELWPPRWLGRLESFDNGVLQEQYAAPPGSISLRQPQSPIPFDDSGPPTHSFALYDIFGTPRTTGLSRGAVQPA